MERAFNQISEQRKGCYGTGAIRVGCRAIGGTIRDYIPPKEISRSANTSTSRLAHTSTSSMMMGSNGHATGSVDVDGRVGMDLEALVAGQSMEKSGSNSLQKEAPKSTGRTSTRTNTSTKTTTGMQKIGEGNEEEEEILGLKTRNWRKIKLSFAIDLNGQEGEDIRGTDYYNEGNNNNKMSRSCGLVLSCWS
jgi:hypothetical protein